jgi:hypothetical protein
MRFTLGKIIDMTEQRNADCTKLVGFAMAKPQHRVGGIPQVVQSVHALNPVRIVTRTDQIRGRGCDSG